MSARSRSPSRSLGQPIGQVVRRVALSAVLCLAVAGCAISPTPGPSSIASDVGRYFSIEEVGLGPEGWVTLHNFTDTPASLETLYLCQPPNCLDLPDVVVEPDQVARIAAGDGSGLDSVAMTGAELDLTPSDGEIALYSTDDVSDSGRLWAYLQWGATPHAGTATAIEAGLWQEGSYAPTSEHATRLYRTLGGLWVFE